MQRDQSKQHDRRKCEMKKIKTLQLMEAWHSEGTHTTTWHTQWRQKSLITLWRGIRIWDTLNVNNIKHSGKVWKLQKWDGSHGINGLELNFHKRQIFCLWEPVCRLELWCRTKITAGQSEDAKDRRHAAT